MQDKNLYVCIMVRDFSKLLISHFVYQKRLLAKALSIPTFTKCFQDLADNQVPWDAGLNGVLPSLSCLDQAITNSISQMKQSQLKPNEKPYVFIENFREFKKNYLADATQTWLEVIKSKKVVRLKFSLQEEDLLQDYNEQVCMNTLYNIYSLSQIYDPDSQTVVVSTKTDTDTSASA